MPKKKLKKPIKIEIPSSKSISNRLLILQYLFPELQVKNLSTAKDTEVLQSVFNQMQNHNSQSVLKLNIGHAGTAMRFLTALLSTIENKEFILDGSERMRQRPIKILVDALRQLGADIRYLQNEGFPPLYIKGKKLEKYQVNIDANVSSQYISALLLIAPGLSQGLEIVLNTDPVSTPYIQMTLVLLNFFGIPTSFDANVIRVKSIKTLKKKDFFVEGDFSSASYFYGYSAVMGKSLELYPFNKNSFQGDIKIKDFFERLGIKTSFSDDNKMIIEPISNFVLPKIIKLDLIDNPDLAQTLAVTCLALKIPCYLTGLQTLKIKETDRLQALKNEIEKFGVPVNIDNNSLCFDDFSNFHIQNISIKTYDDHRMAMSFAIIQKLYPQIKIENPEVVVKSFPDFWDKLNKL